MNIEHKANIRWKKASMRSLIFSLFFLFISHINAQNQRDFALITQLNLQKKITNHFSISLNFRGFWNENITELGRAFGEVGVKYQYNKHWAIAGFYRGMKARSMENLYQDVQRFYVDLSYSRNLTKKIDWSYRARLQEQFYGSDLQDGFKSSRIYTRHKITLNYDYNWYWSPYLSAEIFYPLNRKINFIDQVRATAGVSYKFNKSNSLSAYYQIRKPIYSTPSVTQYVAGLVYGFKF
jgi:hypothetical protein